MRLRFLLPTVRPTVLDVPTACPTPACPGSLFRFHQQVIKPLRDTRYAQVAAARYECLACHHTFRVYPPGVTADQTSQRLQGLAVMLYLLGLSYGAVALALEALAVDLSKTSVYRAVQAAAAAVPDVCQQRVFGGRKAAALGADLTSVWCNGQWVTLGIAVDDVTGVVLSLDVLDGSDAASVQEWLAPIAAAVEAQLLVSDDADSFKGVADELGLAHQVCKAHVRRNTDELVADLQHRIVAEPDGSLAEIGVAAEQAQADLARLTELIATRPVEGGAELDRIQQRYKKARPPQEGAKATVAYRLRLLFLDRANLWPRLTRYRRWRGAGGETVDGTNNACERAIGWWIKERYRAMRSYKRRESAERVSRLLAWSGNYLGRGGAELGRVLA
ncbi:MAG: IS66 family transposase [Chloroflexota bacterium]|nr:IS66 family transposase [Chloroflexota bacterium]